MSDWTIDTGRHRCRIVSTSRAEGDFRVTGPRHDIGTRRRRIVDLPWTWLRQVHGADLVTVDTAGEHAGAEADGAVTFVRNAPVAVTTADCAPVVLIGTTGVAVVHAGWRGALAGIIEAAARRLGAGGARPVASVLGPCVGPAAYAFGEADLSRLTDHFGARVRSVTAAGEPALDMTEVVAAACRRAGWPEPDRPPCTSGDDHYSHRVRGDLGRATTVAWLEACAVDATWTEAP